MAVFLEGWPRFVVWKICPMLYRPKMPLINIKEPVAHNSDLVTCNILSLPFFKK